MSRTLQSIPVAALSAAMVLCAPPRSEARDVAQSPAKASKDACAFLTKEDAATALGGQVNGPDATPARQMGDGSAASSCEYAGTGLHMVHLNPMTFPPATAAAYARLCAQKTNDGLTGLGNVACWYNSKHEELQVLKGTTFFSIELRTSGDPTDTIKNVAKAVYGRLP